MEKRPYISKSEALTKLQRYCAYQERCHQEVRSKLLQLEVRGDELEEIIVELIQDNYLNEERFATSYARGKYRFKKWGRIKIQLELKRRNISAYCIKKAMQEIDETAYRDNLEKVIKTKWQLLKEDKSYATLQKLAAFAIRKGYEPPLVWETIHEL